MAERSRHSRPSEQDRTVCERIRLCRVDSRYSQQALAQEIGLSRDQLKRIEEKRVAPRFWPTLMLCRLLDINPVWLALGAVVNHHNWSDVAPAEVEIGGVPARALFTDAMRKPELLKLFFGSPVERRKLPKRARVNFDDKVEYLARFWKSHVRPTEEQEFFSYLAVAAGQYFRRIVDRGGVKHYLGDMTAIPMSWAWLKRRLQRATRKPGTKAELARRFNVSTAAVSQWLSSKSRIAPKAETTLQLLEWVAAEEVKQNQSAGGVSRTRPARKTRRKSNYEKPSDRKKN